MILTYIMKINDDRVKSYLIAGNTVLWLYESTFG
jgi:hypothetical protein